MSISRPSANSTPKPSPAPPGAYPWVGGSKRVGASSLAQTGNTRTIVVLRKNNAEAIHVRVTDVGGTSLIDLRIFAPDIKRAGEPVPTRNGICIPRRQLRALIEALQMAEESA